MRKLQRSCLLPNRMKKYIFLTFIWPSFLQSQIANYVSNGGFEKVIFGSNPNTAVDWHSIDGLSAYGVLLSANIPPYNVPLSSYTYQWPRNGFNFLATTPYCVTCTYNVRGYPCNKLKSKLENGKTYCFSMFVNLTNKSYYSISSLGAYFSDSSIDTIKYCTIPLTYLTPQIQNQIGNHLSDTLNWVPITGTFVANGTEEYLIVGNFNNDANSDTLFVNPYTFPQRGAAYSFDDISCIEVNLPAYAGPDKSILLGDSVYIGRESDFVIDPGCIWYKLPNITTAIDTSSGIWVKPTVTTTYVVKQVLDCSPEKWDTVVVFMDLVGIEKHKLLSEELKLFPIPAKDEIQLSIFNAKLLKDFHLLSTYNNLGLLIREEEIRIENNSIKIKTDNLPSGVYSLQLKSSSNEIVTKRFVISR
jgi:hypothetical protein